MNVDTCARIAHEANRAWCAFNGDDSQLAWEDAPEWQHVSAVNGVLFHMAFPDAGDSASHDNWMAEKVAAGWVYGPFKDPGAEPPTHPCIVPFEQLPPLQQFKDRLFRTIVHASGLAGPVTKETTTYGQKAVGLAFNPSGDDAVAKCKQTFAAAIDQMNEYRIGLVAGGDGGEGIHLASIAITEAQTAQMWAVKALTWKD